MAFYSWENMYFGYGLFFEIMWNTSLRRLLSVYAEKKLRLFGFFQLGKLIEKMVTKRKLLLLHIGEKEDGEKTQAKFTYSLLWFFLTLLYPCSILPNRGAWEISPEDWL